MKPLLPRVACSGNCKGQGIYLDPANPGFYRKCELCGGSGVIPKEPDGPRPGVDGQIVTLSWEEFSRGALVGLKRNYEDIERFGLTPGGRFQLHEDNGWCQHIAGACGELAVAKFLGVEWRPAKMKRRDVAGFQVRAALKSGGDLAVVQKDSDTDRFILVAMQAHHRFNVCGWITGGEAKQRGKPATSRNGDPMWWVPPGYLRAFDSQMVKS